MMTFIVSISRKLAMVSSITTHSTYTNDMTSKMKFVVSIPTIRTFKVNL